MRNYQPTPEQIERKQALMAKWRAAKEYAALHAADLNQQFAAAFYQHDGERPISLTNFVLVLNQMQERGLEGVPYLHVKDFHGWKKVGRYVRKGEKAQLFSVPWVGGEPEEAEEEGLDESSENGNGRERRLYPKVVALFHLTQTEEREAQ